MSVVYKCKNYRVNTFSYLEGVSVCHNGQVLADLYHPETLEFYRTAVVADCGDIGRAKKYCDLKNSKVNF